MRRGEEGAVPSDSKGALAEVACLTIGGSVLLRLLQVRGAEPPGVAAGMWVSLPLIPLLLRHLPLPPHGYSARSWLDTRRRPLVLALGILTGFTVLGIGWRWCGGLQPVLDVDRLSAETVLRHLLCIAVPEELFFRGYVQERVRRWCLQRQPVAPHAPLLVGAALFALAHLTVLPTWSRAATFVPGYIMGWLRARSGGLLAPTLWHWLANIAALALHL